MHTLFYHSAFGRRLLSLLLAAAMLPVLTACSAADASEDLTQGEGDAISAEEPTIKEPYAPLAPVIPETPGPKKSDAEENSGEGGDTAQSGSETDEDASAPSEQGPYDYSAPVPESAAVDDSYFSDAVFIGDSRTEGFMLYAGPSEASYLTAVGLMVDTIFTEPYIKQGDKKVTVMDALAGMDFSKVYLMLGVNELGWVYGSIFQEYYGRIVDKIREINPDAVIYIQSILPVTAERDAAGSIYNNSRILEFNGLLKELCQEKEVYYVNVAEAVADESGCLPEDDSFDGVHLLPDACKVWLDYLKTHTVEG